MVRLISAGSILLAVGLIGFMVTRLLQHFQTGDEKAIANVLKTVHYSYPIFTFAYYIGSSMMTVFTFKSLRKAKHPKTKNRKKLVLGLSSGIIITYILHGGIILFRIFRDTEWPPTTHENVYVLSSIMIWAVFQVSIIDSTYVIWYPYSGCWYISIGFELLLVSLTGFRGGFQPSLVGIARTAVIASRIILLILLPLLFNTLPQTNEKPISESFDEERGLLSKQRESGVDDEADDNLGIYGSFFDTESDDERTKKTKAKLQVKWEESGNWWNYAKSFSIFWPMIWPSKDRKLKVYMFLICVTLVGQSVLNVLVPRQFGLVTDSLLKATHVDDKASSPWVQVSLFIVFKLLQSNAGLFAVKDYLWIPVQQYSYRMITTSAYNHILSLSYDFHCDKRSGELFASISNARSINFFIDMMLFSFIPMLADLLIAFVYLYFLFGPYMALLVAFVTVSFLWSTSKMANYSQCTRRDFLKASRKEGDTMWETVSNWQNISYFNNLKHEQDRYLDAVSDYQRFERKHNWGTSFLKILQALIFTLGLLGACYLAVYAILNGTQPVGSFVTLLLYWTQLSAPLTFFADFFRRLNTSMIDAERVLEILSLKPTVTNRKNARELIVKDGEVALDTVHFDYDERKPALRGISLRAKPGTTVAIVGETGGGKSTILRLLFRFYDVKKGSVKIDGQDIRDVTLESLRDAIGVVPQDPTLFNDTIMNNLRYANFKATDHDIYRACEAAAIHSQILAFPDGYNSVVGERGVKLSGGELQRIAIARAIIKNPKIILLDEATSMVDMHTERRIQKAFGELAKGRTTFVIAHRLSTIVNADQIIVIHDGKIKEIGTHEELLRRGDAYHKLWNKQIRESASGNAPRKQTTPLVANEIGSSTTDDKPGVIGTLIKPASQSLSTAPSNSTTICQPPQLLKMHSFVKNATPDHTGSNGKGGHSASLPVYTLTGLTMSVKPSTLKADAPEYIPLAADTPRPALPPAYSVGRANRMRGRSFPASQSPPSLVEASELAAVVIDSGRGKVNDTQLSTGKTHHGEDHVFRSVENGELEAEVRQLIENGSLRSKEPTELMKETGKFINTSALSSDDDSGIELEAPKRRFTTRHENTPVVSLARSPVVFRSDLSTTSGDPSSRTRRVRLRYRANRDKAETLLTAESNKTANIGEQVVSGFNVRNALDSKEPKEDDLVGFGGSPGDRRFYPTSAPTIETITKTNDQDKIEN
ncbi:hypothetical protein TWF694_000683 [Orbilia ellipsospora]|uniref:Heavy metal tolerance protein n=1 Tax=Orbilia ellipsospora TaxID=2528407 RepID=A0AAV9XPD5_9PEZI